MYMNQHLCSRCQTEQQHNEDILYSSVPKPGQKNVIYGIVDEPQTIEY